MMKQPIIVMAKISHAHLALSWVQINGFGKSP